MHWLLVLVVIMVGCSNNVSPLSLTNTAVVETRNAAHAELSKKLLANPRVISVENFWVAVEKHGLVRVGGNIEIAIGYDPAQLIETLIADIQETFPNRQVLIDVGLLDSMDVVAQIDGNITDAQTRYNILTYGTTNPAFATEVATAIISMTENASSPPVMPAPTEEE